MDIGQVEKIRHLMKYHDRLNQLKGYYSYTRANKFLKKYFSGGTKIRNLIFIRKGAKYHVFNVRNGLWNGFILIREVRGTEYVFKPAEKYVITKTDMFGISYFMHLLSEKKIDIEKDKVFPQGFDFKKYYELTGVKFVIPEFEEDKIIY
jgi:hypothetical protein